MLMSFRAEVSVLLVCSANICRSPMALGLLREELKLRGMARRVRLDSAGSHATQPGHAVDGRARQACAREGIRLRRGGARQVAPADFLRNDYLIGMDQRNLAWLLAACPGNRLATVSLLGSWAPGVAPYDIPDPYYGTAALFEQVLALMHPAVAALAAHLERRLNEGATRASGN